MHLAEEKNDSSILFKLRNISFCSYFLYRLDFQKQLVLKKKSLTGDDEEKSALN